MPKVKLVLTDSYTGSGDYDDTVHWIKRDITDWEELTQEELDFLRTYRYDLGQLVIGGGGFNSSVMIIQQDETPLIDRIKNLKELLAEKIARDKAATARRQAAAAKAAKERAIKLAEKRAAKEQKDLEKLAETLGLPVADLIKLRDTNGSSTT